MAEKGLKRAVQQVITDDYGNRRLAYIDVDTGLEVTNLANYKIITDAEYKNSKTNRTESIQDNSISSLVDDSFTGQVNGTGTVSPSTDTGRGGTTNPPTSGNIKDAQKSLGTPNGTTKDTSNPVGIATPDDNRDMNIDRSAGLGNLATNRERNASSNNQAAGFVNDFASAGYRKGTPDQGFINSVTEVAGKQLGPETTVTGYSGVGEYGSPRHRDERGIAMDATISKGGQPVGKQAMEDLAMAYALDYPNAGIGYDKNYMGPQNIHLDQYAAQDRTGRSWGAGGKRVGMDENLASNLDFARSMANTDFSVPPTFDAPTPFGPTATQSAPTATGDFLDLSTPSMASDMTKETTKESNAALDSVAGKDMTQASMAEFSGLGLGPQRTEQDIRDMGYTFAGELSAAQLAALAEDDPNAIAELGAMLSTVENRAQSSRFAGKTIQDVLTAPSQYNSLDAKNQNITSGNFAKYGDVLIDKIKDYYSPNTPSTATSSTHYANMGMVDPSWGSKMSDVRDIGPHTFGALSNEYGASKTARDQALDRYSSAQIGNMTSKGGFQADLGRFGDMTEAVSQANGESQGGRGRDGYGASSAGSRTGAGSGSDGVSSRSEGGGLRSDGGGFSSGSTGYGADMSRFDGMQGAVEAANSRDSSSGKSGSSDKGTSSYGGARSSGDAQSSGKSGGGSKSSGGGFSSGRTSGKTDDN